MSKTRVIVIVCIGIWEFIASGLSSLILCQHWFIPVYRGIFVLILSLSTIILRILQILYYKCKLSGILKRKITVQYSNNSKLKHNNNKSDNKQHVRSSSNHSISNNIKSDNLPLIMNYNFVLLFIAYSTLVDASFDIIQSVMLICGYVSSTHYLIIIGSIIGVGGEIINFLESILGFGVKTCKDCLLNQSMGEIMEKLLCIAICLMCITEQTIFIYVIFFVYKAFDTNSYNNSLFTVNFMSFILAIMYIVIGIMFILYAIKHSKVIDITIDSSLNTMNSIKNRNELNNDTDYVSPKHIQIISSVMDLYDEGSDVATQTSTIFTFEIESNNISNFLLHSIKSVK